MSFFKYLKKPMLNTSPQQQAVSPKRDKRFDDILKLSRRMLEDAGKGDWDRTAQLQAQRQQLMNDYFVTPVPEAEAGVVASGIREMLDIDRKLIEHSKQAMNGLSSDLKKINKGKHASRAYVVNM